MANSKKFKAFRKIENLVNSVTFTGIITLLTRIALDTLYFTYITRFHKRDFPPGEINMMRLFESYLIALVLSAGIAVLLRKKRYPSKIVLVLYLTIVILPLTSLYGLSTAPATFVYASIGSFAVLAITSCIVPKIKVPYPSRDLVYIGLTFLILIFVYSYTSLALTGGVGRFNLSMLKVYEVRAEYVQRRWPLLGYFVPWQAHVFNISGIIYALRYKNYPLLSLCFIAQLLLFGFTGHKSFLFAPFLCIGIYWVWQKRNPIAWLLTGILVVMVASYGYFLMTGNKLMPSLFIRRLFFVPARLHVLYYDFFSQPEHPFYILSDSILKGIIQNPYSMPMPRVIALAYWGRDFWPNVGYLGDAYGNLGIAGMFLFSLILGLFLRLVDSIGSRLPDSFVAAIIAMPALSLTESALFTSLLTHGFIPALLMLWMFSALERRRIGNGFIPVRVPQEKRGQA